MTAPSALWADKLMLWHDRYSSPAPFKDDIQRTLLVRQEELVELVCRWDGFKPWPKNWRVIK